MNIKLPKPLSEKELDKLSCILSGFSNEKAMNLEQIDGFFAAFHCSPEMIPLSEYLSYIWGDETGEEESPFETMEDLNNFMKLLMRHWNDVGRRFDEEIFSPCVLDDPEAEKYPGNDWATGFLKGMRIAEGFQEMLDDTEKSKLFVPIFAFAYEFADDPKLRPFSTPISQERREDLFALMCEGVTHIYHYFSPHRKSYAREYKERNTLSYSSNKIGRNDLCDCGSGVKYKKCCLKHTIH